MKQHFLVIVGSLVVIAALGTAIFFGSRQECIVARSGAEKLVVGTNATFAPFTFIENDQIVGFDIDIAKEVAKRLNKPMQLKNLSFDALIPELQLGTIHFAAAGFTATPERAKRVAFSTIYLSGDPLVVVTRAGEKQPRKIEDFVNKPVIVNRGFTADTYASAIPNIDLLRLDTVAEALLALKTKRGDAFVTANKVIKRYLSQNPQEQLDIAIIEETDENCALAISPHYKELVEPINNALAAMEKDGTIQQLKEKWFPHDY